MRNDKQREAGKSIFLGKAADAGVPSPQPGRSLRERVPWVRQAREKGDGYGAV